MPNQANHFSGTNIETYIFEYATTAISEADITNLDLALHAVKRHRALRVRYAGDVIQDIENSFRARCRLLGMRNDSTHRIQSCVKPCNIGKKGSEHPDRDGARRDL